MDSVDREKTNYYGSLCTELYEILHKEAPEDELNFYLSYAKQGMKILEPLCGIGAFLFHLWTSSSISLGLICRKKCFKS